MNTRRVTGRRGGDGGRGGFTLVEILVVLIIIGLLAAIIVPRFVVARNESTFAVCSQNLKNLAVSLQAYANDNEQVYPITLDAIVPHYVEALPTCPSSKGSNCYVLGYEKSDLPTTFTVLCKGRYHVDSEGVGPDRPIFTFEHGMLSP